MNAVLAYLREFNFISVAFRLFLAAGAGGLIGYGRSKKNRNAGIRTFMLTATAAALTILTGIYEYEMMNGPWAEAVGEVGMKFDVSRIASNVIAGTGFLAGGAIVATSHKQVSGLTSATGLFASVSMGMAAGAGFYECVLCAVIMIIVALDVFSPLESLYKRRTRNINLYVEFDNISSIAEITNLISARNALIYDIDVERTETENFLYPSAVFNLKLSKESYSHSDILSSIAELPCVYSVEELIS